RLHVSNEAIDEFIVNARIDDDPIRAHADLALMEETADDGRPYRMFQVGIVEDDERRVAAEFQCHPLELRGLHRQRTDMSAHPRRTQRNSSTSRLCQSAGSFTTAAISGEMVSSVRVQSGPGIHQLLRSRRIRASPWR